MSQITHVSSSVLSGEAGEAGEADGAEKGLAVTAYVVGALFAEKKRILTEAVEAEMASLMARDAPGLQCACFRRRNDAEVPDDFCGEQWGLDEPCAEQVKLRKKMFKKIAREKWPALERGLVSDLAHCICEARDKLTRQLAEDAAAAARIMRKQRQKIGALQHALGLAQKETALVRAEEQEHYRAQARALEDARGENATLRARLNGGV
jgi:hypothetical protein